MRNKIILAALIALLMVSCGKSRDKELAQIAAMEESLGRIAVDYAKADSLIALYTQFADHFQKDSLAPIYLMKAADVSINVGKAAEAVQYLDRIIDNYPDYADMGGCYFLKGLAFERSEQFDLAKEAYTFFVETYPDHELASDTKKMIPLLGLSSEEMMDWILENANDSGLTMNE